MACCRYFCIHVWLLLPTHISAVIYTISSCPSVFRCLIDSHVYLALGGDFPHQIRLTPFILLSLDIIYMRTGPGRTENQAGPSNYKGKEKAPLVFDRMIFAPRGLDFEFLVEEPY